MGYVARTSVADTLDRKVSEASCEIDFWASMITPTQVVSGKNTCDEQLMSIRYTKAAEEWPGAYWHEETKSLLIVYVDDFKLSAKAERHDAI